MVTKRDLVTVVLLTFCLTTVLLTITPTRSAPGIGEYDPWCDVNDDGVINIFDVVALTSRYGKTGAPITKASVEYDSGWIDVADKFEETHTITHSLNMTKETMLVDARGRGLGWNKTYGGTYNDVAYALAQTGDGGYALAGGKISYGTGGYDAWLVRTNSNGDTLWSHIYGGTGDDLLYSVVQTSNGDYALAGCTNSFGNGGLDFWLVKTDPSGNTQWNRAYGGTWDDWARGLVETADGGYAIAGITKSHQAGITDAWLIKTDANGNTQWNRTYGGTDNDGALALIRTGDGGYAIAGTTYSYGAGSSDFWLVKTDSAGNALWNRTYGGGGGDFANALVQTTDGGYALAGYTRSYGAGSSDSWLVKTDSAGNAQWSQTYGGTSDEYAYALAQTTDGEYAIAGYTNSYGAGSSDFWLVKTNTTGHAKWSKTYGGTSNDQAYALVKTGDGGYALTGYTYSRGAGLCDFWLVKIDAAGNAANVEAGLAWIDSTANTITLRRETTEPYWSFVRVRIWKPKTP